MKFEILNMSGLTPSGNLGLDWSAYSIDASIPKITVIGTEVAASESLNDQLAAIAALGTKIVIFDPNVKAADILITGEWLSISSGTKSIVKQAFLNLIR